VTVYITRRILQAIPLIIGASILTFLLIHIAPGDPIVALAGEDGNAEYYAEMRARFGLDRPVGERLLVYLGSLARGDLGYSYRFNQPALTVILARLPTTLLLMIPALFLAIIVGIGLGVIAAARVHTLSDASITTFSLLGHAMPVFWLAQLSLLLFSARLDIFPVQGMTDVRARYHGFRYAADVMYHMILPVTVLAVQYLASITRITRASMLEILEAPFIRTARSKGVPQKLILLRHALRNAMLPIVTIIGGQVGFMFAGAVLTETVFGWPGLGRLLLNAMLSRDYAIITAMFLILSMTIIFSNLVTDILYAYLDPRIRYE
jgi:peptide/nickel transport system permease protein